MNEKIQNLVGDEEAIGQMFQVAHKKIEDQLHPSAKEITGDDYKPEDYSCCKTDDASGSYEVCGEAARQI